MVADISYVSTGKHDYTGIFKGAKLGIMRSSFDFEPEKD